MTIPKEIEIDLSTLTWGELEEIERMTSGATAKAMLGGEVYPSAMVALAFVVLRRKDPSILLEEVRGMPVSTEVKVKDSAPLDPTSSNGSNGDSPVSPRSVGSTDSALPSYEE